MYDRESGRVTDRAALPLVPTLRCRCLSQCPGRPRIRRRRLSPRGAAAGQLARPGARGQPAARPGDRCRFQHPGRDPETDGEPGTPYPRARGSCGVNPIIRTSPPTSATGRCPCRFGAGLFLDALAPWQP
ncbi:hypothetical protein ACRAWF_02455 [Streptomyces sp. L7]